ncbi:MAG TPA: hypothetical protein VE089_10825 [Nitrososphaeraceae archaeon]|jgi:hypothetical protein|nr:hypothetical protein [Nitrososphaeraceae archaeon]
MSNPDVTQSNVRPGLKAGRSNEFTLIMPLKPGGAERLRKKLASSSDVASKNQGLMDRVGTVHDLRFVIFDNDSRLLFASTFDGDWDAYINDFAAYIPDQLDLIFGEVEDYPGIRSPNIKDYIVKYQVPATYFYSAYPNASVRDVWKAMKIKGGLDVLLDAASS